MNHASLQAPHKNIDFVSYSDQGGRGDGVQIMVYKGHAYIGHMFSNGVTVMDITDPRHPRPVNFLPTPPNTWSLHLQASNDLLLVINAVNIYSPNIHIEKAQYYSQSFADTFGKQQLEFSAGMRVYDISRPDQPREIGFMPVEEDYCAKGGHFGPHNLHENRPSSFQSSQLIFATYQNAGIRVFDIKNPFRPAEVAYFVPPAPQRMFDPRPQSPQVIQTCDVFVDAQGLIYLTDYNAGLYILEYKGS